MGSFPLTKFGIVPFDGPLPATLLINHHVHHKYENTNTINIVIINCLMQKHRSSVESFSAWIWIHSIYELLLVFS